MFPTRIEIIPTDDIVTKVSDAVPASTTLTVTCLRHHGIERTMQAAIKLSLLGYNVVPHLAAKGLTDRAQLSGILRDCEVAGITEVFAIGGDGPQSAGPYNTAEPMMRDIAELSGGKMAIGVAGYPEGHPGASGLHFLDSLVSKQELATNVVTQMCFSAERINNYAGLLRREGIILPILAGVPGPVPKTRLVSLALKIGVGPSVRFLSRRGPLARRLLSGENYSPATLIDELSARPSVDGIHLYSFNCLESLPAAGPARQPTAATL